MRSIEEMQASIKNIQCELQQLRSDLDDIRSEKNGGALNFDISEVSVKAKREPISPHPLSQKDEYIKRQYLILLLSVAQFDQDKLYDSLLFAHRIAYGCGYLTNGDLLDEYTSSHMLTFTQLDELISLFSKDDLRLMLIEEMLLMAGKFEKGLKPAVDYISQVCRLLNVTNKEIMFLSQMSTVILTGNLGLYNCNIKNSYYIFDCYLKEIDFNKFRNSVILNIPEKIMVKVWQSMNPYTWSIAGEKIDLQFKSAGIMKDGDILTICTKYETSICTKSATRVEICKHITTTQKIDNDFILFANHVDKEQFGTPIGISINHPLDSIDAANFFKFKGGIIHILEDVSNDFITNHDIGCTIIN